MFIKSLRIRKTATDEIVREVLFHKGANLIVDTEDSESHNRVGKTTFLKLIDIAMGAKDRKLIYTDADTGTVTKELRDFIVSNKVAVDMTLASDLPDGDDVVLIIDLFPNGRYYIDGEKVGQKTYQQRLNALLFGNEANVPTFRQLINSFVRVSVGGDDNSFLKTVPSGSTSIYRSVYNALFGISDPALDKKRDNLNKDLNKTRESIKRYKKVQNVNTISEQQQILAGLEAEHEEVQRRLNSIIDADVYRANRDEIAATRTRYASLTLRLSDIDYRLQRNEEALQTAEQERSRQADVDLSRRFFEEVCSMIPAVNATFEEMVAFNNQLCDNKITYFASAAKKLKADRASMQREINQLSSQNSQFMSLVEQDLIDEYEVLQARLVELSSSIGKCREVIDTLNSFDAEQASIEGKIALLGSSDDGDEPQANDFTAMMMAFNAFFTPLAREFNNESPILVYYEESNKFPVAIRDIAGSSTGTRKSLIAAFDLAYQQFAESKSIKTPRFIVHDVLENIEGKVLRDIIARANTIDCQYIVAVLKEKLDSSLIPVEEQSKLQILQLSIDDMLFTRDEAAASQE